MNFAPSSRKFSFLSLLVSTALIVVSCMSAPSLELLPPLIFLLIVLVIIVLADTIKGRQQTKDKESDTEAPLREEIVHARDVRAVYTGIVSSFVFLVIFCILLKFYPASALEFLTPYIEYIFLAGVAVIFLLGTFYRRREETTRQTQ